MPKPFQGRGLVKWVIFFEAAVMASSAPVMPSVAYGIGLRQHTSVSEG